MLETLIVIFGVIPVGAAMVLVTGLYGAQAVRKTWRRK